MGTGVQGQWAEGGARSPGGLRAPGSISGAAGTCNIHTQLTVVISDGLQGLEDGGSFSGGADGLQVRWQGLVVARGGQDILGLQLGAGCPLPLQVTQFLHGIQLDPEALVLDVD